MSTHAESKDAEVVNLPGHGCRATSDHDREVPEEAEIKTGAVGLITELQKANEIVTGGDADLVFIGRELLREPYWALKAEQALGGEPTRPISYEHAVKRRAK